MRRNFTLVEILVVLGLMAILLFIALPAFEKLAKGHGVDLAARNLTSKLGMARGYAISNREYVAVLMPTNSTTPAVLPNDYLFKGYKLCVVTSNYTTVAGPPQVSTFTFKHWLPSENWEFTPNGTAINDICGTPHAAGSDSDWTPTTPLEKVSGVNLSEINSTYANLNDVRAIVFKPTGKIAISPTLPRYIALSESTYNGATLTPTNKKNWIDITVDQFTGRVTYGTD